MIPSFFSMAQVPDPQLPAPFGVWFLATVIKMIGLFTVWMIGVAYMTLAERRISAWIQDRRGPNRVGPHGLLQPIADGVKNFMKEETLPPYANRALFLLAPMLSFAPAMMAWAVIPFGASWASKWGRIDMVLADLPIGFLFVLAITSLGVYGIVLAGLVSIPLGFLAVVLGSLCYRDRRAEAKWHELHVRAHTGLGRAGAAAH